MYARWKGSCIEYISYGGLVEWVKEPNRLNNDCFRKKFIRPSFKWLSTPFPDFRDKGQDAISQTESCRSLVNLVDQRIKKSSGGIVWVDGVEGSGKSTIMAHLAKRRIDQRDLGKVLTFAYRFERSSFLNRAEYFLHYIYLRLSSAHWNPSTQKWSVSEGTNEAFDPACIVSAEEILNLFKKKTQDPLSMMLFVLDDIDDMNAKDSMFLDKVLFPLTKDSRILLVVSGMHGTPVAEQFRKSGASVVFADGLAPLTLREFTSVLCTACGDSSTKLLDLQTQAERESHAFAENPERVAGEDGRCSFGFLAEAHRKGSGSPLYATYLAEDLRSGAVKIGDITALPTGIEGYYDLHLERMGVLGMLNPVPAPLHRAAVSGFIASVQMRRSREMRSGSEQDVEGWNTAFQPTDDHLARASVLALMATDSAALTADEISKRLGQTVLRGQNLERRSSDDRNAEESLSIVDRALEAVSPLLKVVPIDETGKEGFSLAHQSVRRRLNSLSGVQQMAHRFKSRSDDAPPSEPREPRRTDDIPPRVRHSENRFDDRPFEERPNTPEMEERVAACISRFESIKNCSEVSELYSGQNDQGPEDQMSQYIFKGTISEAVAKLQADRDLVLKPSMAFKALAQVGTNFDWRDRLRNAPSVLKNFTWREPSVFGAKDEDLLRERHYYPPHRYGQRHYHRYFYDRHDSSGKSYTLISGLDRALNNWVRSTTRFSNDRVEVSGVSTPTELEGVCNTVAEILNLVRDGADLHRIDAYPVMVQINMRKKNENSLAEISSIEFVFRDLPVRVSIDINIWI